MLCEGILLMLTIVYINSIPYVLGAENIWLHIS